jgi:hypothetical protein
VRPTGLDLCQTHQPAGALTVINTACGKAIASPIAVSALVSYGLMNQALLGIAVKQLQEQREFARTHVARAVLRHGRYGDRSESRGGIPAQTLLWLAPFVLAKPVLTFAATRAVGYDRMNAGRAGAVLAHASELTLVIITQAMSAALLPAGPGQAMLVAAALSMGLATQSLPAAFRGAGGAKAVQESDALARESCSPSWERAGQSATSSSKSSPLVTRLFGWLAGIRHWFRVSS